MWIALSGLVLLLLALGFLVWRWGSYAPPPSSASPPSVLADVTRVALLEKECGIYKAELAQAKTKLSSANAALAEANALIEQQKESFLIGSKKVQASIMPLAHKLAELQQENAALNARLAERQSTAPTGDEALTLAKQLDAMTQALALEQKELSDTKRLLGLAQAQAQSVTSARRALGDEPESIEKPGWIKLTEAHEWVAREVKQLVRLHAIKQARFAATKAALAAAKPKERPALPALAQMTPSLRLASATHRDALKGDALATAQPTLVTRFRRVAKQVKRQLPALTAKRVGQRGLKKELKVVRDAHKIKAKSRR